jgi:DNA-binding GntR family transcriptional regulator
MNRRPDQEPRPHPTSIGDFTIQRLKADLIEGRLRPGERLTAEGVSQKLSVSHIPVREALRFLEAEGHLIHDPWKGYTVAPVSPEEAEDIYRVRALIESYAYEIGVPLLTEEDDAALEGWYAEMEAAVVDGDVARFARANRHFHFVPFVRTQHNWLLRFISMLWDAAARYQTSLFSEDGWEHRLQQHHHELLAAMRQRDPARVNEIMDMHRQVTTHAALERASSGRTGVGLPNVAGGD